MSFEYPLPLDANVLAKLKAAGIDKAYEVQILAATTVMAGEDCKIAAPTGSGKTLSYLMPLVCAM